MDPKKPQWMTERWLTEEELSLRFGLPDCLVREMTHAGVWCYRLPVKYDDAGARHVVDAKAFGKLPMLKEKQVTRIARDFQKERGLSHILPTSWDRILSDHSRFS